MRYAMISRSSCGTTLHERRADHHFMKSICYLDCRRIISFTSSTDRLIQIGTDIMCFSTKRSIFKILESHFCVTLKYMCRSTCTISHLSEWKSRSTIQWIQCGEQDMISSELSRIHYDQKILCLFRIVTSSDFQSLETHLRAEIDKWSTEFQKWYELRNGLVESYLSVIVEWSSRSAILVIFIDKSKMSSIMIPETDIYSTTRYDFKSQWLFKDGDVEVDDTMFTIIRKILSHSIWRFRYLFVNIFHFIKSKNVYHVYRLCIENNDRYSRKHF